MQTGPVQEADLESVNPRKIAIELSKQVVYRAMLLRKRRHKRSKRSLRKEGQNTYLKMKELSPPFSTTATCDPRLA